MYTGRLDLKEGTYKKMYETAQTLQMSVLTKLMDAQVNGVSVGPENRKPVKRSNGAFDDDPVEQIRKIRKIEKQVAQEERKRVVTARTKQEELARLPGKKLPIWKRRTPETLSSKIDPPLATAEEQNCRPSAEQLDLQDTGFQELGRRRLRPTGQWGPTSLTTTWSSSSMKMGS